LKSGAEQAISCGALEAFMKPHHSSSASTRPLPRAPGASPLPPARLTAVNAAPLSTALSAATAPPRHTGRGTAKLQSPARSAGSTREPPRAGWAPETLRPRSMCWCGSRAGPGLRLPTDRSARRQSLALQRSFHRHSPEPGGQRWGSPRDGDPAPARESGQQPREVLPADGSRPGRTGAQISNPTRLPTAPEGPSPPLSPGPPADQTSSGATYPPDAQPQQPPGTPQDSRFTPRSTQAKVRPSTRGGYACSRGGELAPAAIKQWFSFPASPSSWCGVCWRIPRRDCVPPGERCGNDFLSYTKQRSPRWLH